MTEFKKIDISLIIKTAVIYIASSVGAIFIFALFMYLLEKGYEYSPLFATVSMALGGFVAALYLGAKLQKKGILVGVAVGGISFLLVTLITLFVNSGAVTVHILLRMVIFLLAAVIGGIIGVNIKNEPKYI